jgi:hypothetical protein
MKKLLAFVALTTTFAATGVVVDGASSATSPACRLQLQVNVFGPSSPQSNWALQGGLAAGQLATLRATSTGCTLDHITGRWVSGGTGIIPGTPRACGGTICILRVRSQKSAAADFQAFAQTPGGFMRSNIVRVAWTGEGLEGTYTTNFRGTVTTGEAHIALTGNTVMVTNERGQVAEGTYNPTTHQLILTAGWPDIVPGTPFIGRVSNVGGRIRIDWPVLKDGKPGGFWIHD